MAASGDSTPAGPGMNHQSAAAQSGSAEAVGRLLELCRRSLLALASRELDVDIQAKVGPSEQQAAIEPDTLRGG